MFDFKNFDNVSALAALCLLCVFAYYVLVALILRIPRSPHVCVTRYEPPPGISPAVTAWLRERGRLPRAIAAALVSMAAKGYVKIEQSEDLFSVTQIATPGSIQLEPEEDAFAWKLFRGYDSFDFAESTPELAKSVEAFRIALSNTHYLLPHVGLSVPAWGVSGIASAVVLFSANLFGHGSGRGLGYLMFATVGCFVVGIRTLPGTIEKITSRLPGSTLPKRPWTGSDTRPFLFLAGALAGISLIGLMSNALAAFLAGGFMAVNAVFYFALQGPTAAGRELLAQMDDYGKFLSGVEADLISRVDPSDHVPARLDTKHAFAVALHLDFGWGEQFVTSIADVIECTEVFEKADNGNVPGLSDS